MNSSRHGVVVRERAVNSALHARLIENGFQPTLADLLARRLDAAISLKQVLSPTLASIPDPEAIPDMARAVERIVEAILGKETIAFAVDHDMDGQASAAVLWKTFTEIFEVSAEFLSVVTSHRLTEGYGITDAVAERILLSTATLVISADKGSSDEPRIRRIALGGKDVVVTDHHEVPEAGPPPSALACVNPARVDSAYDRHVCGAGVAFLTMAKVRTRLLEKGYRRHLKSLASLTDYVAVATIADCVALRPDRGIVNRAFIRSGLASINRAERPCWKVLRRVAKDEGPINSQTVAFLLAPAVAAAGRLDWAEHGLRFLLASTEREAEKHWETLERENALRKFIEKEVREVAVKEAAKQEGASICVLIENGHSGVHGITASRLVERFGKPSAVFSPKGAGARNLDGTTASGNQQVITGSFRSIDGVHIRDVLSKVEARHPGLLLAYGGHAGAAGATLLRTGFPVFKETFEIVVREAVQGQTLAPTIWTDGRLSASSITLETADVLADLDPWGKDFPLPIFTSEFQVRRCEPMGDGSHWRVWLEVDSRMLECVWFNATLAGGDPPVAIDQTITALYRLSARTYRSRRSLQIELVHVT